MPIVDQDQFEKGHWYRDFSFGNFLRCSDDVIDGFLQALSARLLKDRQVREFSDVATFGYFCRKANIARVRKRLPNPVNRTGWGTVVHIAPSNIPVNFAFSFLMGLLSGNSNLVRIPTQDFRQTDLILAAVDHVCEEDRFLPIKQGTCFFRSERTSPRLKQIISEAAGLVVWGGDQTVQTFRALPKRASAVEVYFPDRVSSAVFSAKEVLGAQDQELDGLCEKFFNDTFLVDQNACSSPGILFWCGEKSLSEKARKRFWEAFEVYLRSRYRLDPVVRINKYLDVMQMVVNKEQGVAFQQGDEGIWKFQGENLGSERFRFGNFLEMYLSGLQDIAPCLRENEQTLTVYGVSSKDLFQALLSRGKVVDRIVPVGQALNIGMVWDGKDVMSLLSRETELV